MTVKSIPMSRSKIVVIITMMTVMLVCLLSSCGGGFRGDSEEAAVLGPGIFGPDSSRKK